MRRRRRTAAPPITVLTGLFTPGNDLITGGAGDDSALGDAGFDTLYGNGGQDQLSGGDDRDLIYGDDGDNLALQNLDEFDRLFGGAGNDTLYGEEERDTLAGGDGTDTMFGGISAELDLFLIDATDSVLAFANVNRIEDLHDGGGTGSGEVVQILGTTGLTIGVGDAGLVGGDAGEAIIFVDNGSGAGLDAGDQLIVFLDDVSVADAILGTDIILVP